LPYHYILQEIAIIHKVYLISVHFISKERIKKWPLKFSSLSITAHADHSSDRYCPQISINQLKIVEIQVQRRPLSLLQNDSAFSVDVGALHRSSNSGTFLYPFFMIVP